MPQNIKQQFEEVRRKRQERIANAVGWEKKMLLGVEECKDIDWHIDLMKQTLQALATEMMEENQKAKKVVPEKFCGELYEEDIHNNALSEVLSAQQAVAKKWGLV